jgi:hypothetical protein
MRAAQSGSHEDGGQKWLWNFGWRSWTRRDMMMRLIRFNRIRLVHAEVSRFVQMLRCLTHGRLRQITHCVSLRLSEDWADWSRFIACCRTFRLFHTVWLHVEYETAAASLAIEPSLSQCMCNALFAAQGSMMSPRSFTAYGMPTGRVRSTTSRRVWGLENSDSLR